MYEVGLEVDGCCAYLHRARAAGIGSARLSAFWDNNQAIKIAQTRLTSL